MDKMFWTDVAKKGAILGVLMLASHILEQVLMLNGNTSRMFVAGIEMLVVAVLYIYLMYRFVKGYSNTFSAEEGFSYGRGFTYVVYASGRRDCRLRQLCVCALDCRLRRLYRRHGKHVRVDNRQRGNACLVVGNVRRNVRAAGVAA